MELINEVTRNISATIWCLYNNGNIGWSDRHAHGWGGVEVKLWMGDASICQGCWMP